MKKKKVLVIQPLLAHYRNSLFEHLVASREMDIKVIAGNPINNIKEITPATPKIAAALTNRKLRIAGHTFIWQWGSVSYTLKDKPDILVLTGVDPHLISNLWLSIICKLFLNTKVIWWGHAGIEKKSSSGKHFRRFFFNLAKGVFTYNDEGQRNLSELLNNNIEIVSIKNCINDEDYGYKMGFALPAEGPVGKGINILFSGRITKEKRLDLLIEALGILKEKAIVNKCFIIGEGSERLILENKVQLLGLSESVNFVGEQYQEQCFPYFKNADLFVLPGKVGLSIIHGLSFGLPVLTSGKTEIHSPEYEIITPGYNGDFFHEFDANDLAEKIALWSEKLTRNKKEITQTCVASITENGYTPAIMSEKMIALFRRLN